MKLIIAIAHDRDKNRVTDSLVRNGLSFTKIGSTGGFLREGNVTLLVGVEDEKAEEALDILRTACGSSEKFVNAALPGGMSVVPPQPIRVAAGGVVAFVVSVDSFERF